MDATGAAPLGNAGNGVSDDGDRNWVGGVEPGAGNVIGANGGHGVSRDTVHDGQVVANAIGTDASGVVNLGNARSGVHTLASTHMIGSIDPAVPPNTIAFNAADVVTRDNSRRKNGQWAANPRQIEAEEATLVRRLMSQRGYSRSAALPGLPLSGFS